MKECKQGPEHIGSHGKGSIRIFFPQMLTWRVLLKIPPVYFISFPCCIFLHRSYNLLTY